MSKEIGNFRRDLGTYKKESNGNSRIKKYNIGSKTTQTEQQENYKKKKKEI